MSVPLPLGFGAEATFVPKKHLGQNFLVDKKVIKRIVEACELKSDETVFEIGPGQGALTREILPKVGGLIAVETDRVLAQRLQEEFSDGKVVIHHADFLRFDLNKIPPSLGRIKALGNIPYYISSPIMGRVLDGHEHFSALFMTAQLEFGARLAAKPGTRDYSSLTCFVNYFTEPKMLFRIPPGAFRPAPKVWSCFMRLTVRQKPAVEVSNEAVFLSTIRHAFLHRRKTLVNSLSSLYPKDQVAEILSEVGIQEKVRAEELSLEDYAKMTNKITQRGLTPEV